MARETDALETVTIVMPVYNPGKYLAPCLDSLLAQTFGDFRLIAIDDGSTDGSGEVLRAYAAEDSRILAWWNPENLGAARTRNIGIQMAKGTYLSVVDADDFYEPDYLETMVGAMERYGVDVATCDFYDFNEQTGKKRASKVPDFLRKRLEKPFQPEELPNEIFLTSRNNPFAHMFRRAFLKERSLQFQDIAAWNDLYFTKMGLMLAKTVFHVQRPLASYRIHTGNQISSSYVRRWPCFYDACMAMRSTLLYYGRFELFKRALYEYFLNTLRCLLPNLLQELGPHVCTQLTRGFQTMGMKCLERMDFPSTLSYWFWQACVEGKALSPEELKEMPYDAFFRDLSGLASHIALWGYGKLGREFMHMAERHAFPIEEIYDRDAGKWDAAAHPRILSFSVHNPQVDAVIVTNSDYYEDIAQEIWKQDRNVRVYDFSRYVAIGRLNM